LKIYKSGRMKITFGNTIALEVLPSTHSSFVQQVVVVDPDRKSLYVLGDLKEGYVVSPDIEAYLDHLDSVKHETISEVGSGLEGLQVL